jgi:hypothetical protein
MSIWLSGANAVMGVACSRATAEAKRQATAIMAEGTKQMVRFWTGGLAMATGPGRHRKQLGCTHLPRPRRQRRRFALVGTGATTARTLHPFMTDPQAVSTDIAGVVQALSNGLRSQIEMAKQARLPLDRIRIALDWLVARSA